MEKGESARILAIDVGGSHLKAAILDAAGNFVQDPLRVKTPTGATPDQVVKELVSLVKPLKQFERVSIGFPGYVRDGTVRSAPNLGHEAWRGYNLAKALEKALGKPVRLANDADVQGLAAIGGRGLELVCTLGTGFGTGWFRNGQLLPHMELAHIRVGNKKDLDGYLGDKARRKIGDKKWNKRIQFTVAMLAEVLNFDRLYLGGGNAERITCDIPENAEIIPNADGLKGGALLWSQPGRH